MITYNHEKFIHDAIKGVLLQKTNCPIELVIGEDCSTDNTRAICEKYEKENPQIIRILPAEKNLGGIANFIRTLSACSGKYIAICEGDDYWTDPLKLQKQVDILENNADIGLCFHNAKVTYASGYFKPHPFSVFNKTIYNIEDVIQKDWFIPTQSIVFRKALLEVPNWIKYVFSGDLSLQLLIAAKSNYFCIDEIMSVYRKHDLSITKQMRYSSYDVNKKIKEVLLYFNMHSDFRYNAIIQNRIKERDAEDYRMLLMNRPFLRKIFNIDFYFYKSKSLIKKLNRNKSHY